LNNNFVTNREKIHFYKSLFRGREDVFAKRWESADRTRKGYTPVCKNEWKSGLCLKLGRGKCRDCSNKEYASFDDYRLIEHLSGKKAYGLYPLLSDNTSYFLAIDFDGKNWQKDVEKFIKICKEYRLEANIERSNSGNGGHAWFFFEDKYPAEKSRFIFKALLEKIGAIDKFSPDASFDRIFPSQDSLNKDGMGNLILLPLQGNSKEIGNTVFMKSNLSEPIEDQWENLSEITKISHKFLDNLYDKLSGIIFNQSKDMGNVLQIEISNRLIIKNRNMPQNLINFLKENLNFFNPEYAIKKKMGIGVYNVEKYFNLIEPIGSAIAVPRGFVGKLLRFLDEQGLKYVIEDNRVKLDPVKFESSLKLRDYQNTAHTDLMLSEQGILVAPPGSGKTIIGLELITQLKQPAMIIVHKKQIFNQWVERIESFLNIPKKQIGQICSGKKEIGEKITVAMIQTLNRIDTKEIDQKFGLVMVDECHHMPAKMFRNVITKFNPFYLYGLTATPDRKYKDERLIFIYLGEVLHKIGGGVDANPSQNSGSNQKLEIKTRETDFSIPFRMTMDNSQLVYKMLIFDTKRNEQICSDAALQVRSGSKCLILTERVEHVDALNAYLSGEFETIALSGALTEKNRKIKLDQIETGYFDIIIATGQLLGEGTDISSLDTLFLVYPCSFSGKLTQYIGRITRKFNEKTNSKVYDYRDLKVSYLDRIYKRRKSYYGKNNFKIL
jgi:superfamily II DNA or RNA helicase